MKKKHNYGKCRLCSQEGKLCHSHIIPEFLYTPLYDSKKRGYNVLSTHPKSHRQWEQKGIREYLLCPSCEVRFNRWETYASQVLFHKTPDITFAAKGGAEFAVDYAQFKLFQLSILWRIGISTHSMFETVVLDAHEPVLRAMLLNVKPGRTEEYGCIIHHSTHHANITSDMIHCIPMQKINGIPFVTLLMGGFFWTFFLSSIGIETRQVDLFLQDSGRLRVLRHDSTHLDKYIVQLAVDFYKADPGRFKQHGHSRKG